VANQQLIEITRAVVSGAQVILLDEPTAALAVGERQALFRVLDALRANGTTIVLVSHNLDEVLAHSDTVTVFRDGRLIETKAAAKWTKRDLIANMLGSSSAELLEAEAEGSKDLDASDARTTAPVAHGPIVLSARGIQLPGRLRDVSVVLRSGEVLGIAGLMGSGRSSLLRALAGAEPGTRGEIEIDGKKCSWPSSPRSARSLGIGMVPEDRKVEGVCLEMSCADNVALPRFRQSSRLGYLSPRRTAADTARHLKAAGVDLVKMSHPARSLSGGNQQKLLFARMSYLKPRILFADEPTRGVDVGVKADILEELRRLAHEDGVAVILASSELEEVLAFSDRIIVMAEGRVVGEFDNAAGDVTEDQLLDYAFRMSGSNS
jgi:ABC-type sugar transport system ATPase subunit